MVLKNSRRRSNKDYTRGRPYKHPRDVVLIVCEGEKTEPIYFKSLRGHLKLHTLKVEVVGGEDGSAAISVVNCALRKIKERRNSNSTLETREYNVVWCVMDVEIPKQESLDKAIDVARRKKLQVALSNPCFEYWFLLHYEKTAHRMQNSDDTINLLKKYMPDYTKNDPNVFQTISQHIETAITNSKSIIRENGYGDDLRNCNPSTHVHKVVERLQSISAEVLEKPS